MRIRIEFDGEVFDLEVGRREGAVTVECEGESVQASVLGVRDAVRLQTGDATHVVEFSSDTEGRLDGRPFHFRVDRFEPGDPVSAGDADGRVSVRAAMQGRLVRVLVEPGQSVSKGEALFIVESMKMQNELQSPRGGVVAEVTAAEGDVVESGRVLAQLEPAAPSG